MPFLKLYYVSDSPPSFAVILGFKAMMLDHLLVEVDFAAGEHLTEEFAEKNPQKELPCLDDNGFILSESIAILQYLADKYDKNDCFYPKDPKKRALVNHRLAFNVSTYARYISEYVMAPIFFDYKRTPEGLNKMKIGLSVFNTILQRQGTKFAASNEITIADFPLVTATMCLEAIDYNFSAYPRVVQWYADFKKDHPQLWEVVEPAMLEIRNFNKSPPDLSGMKHPYHPVRKQ